MKDTLTRQLKIPKDNLIVCKADTGSRIGGRLIDDFINIAILIVIVLIITEGFSILDIASRQRAILIGATIFQVMAFLLNLVVPAFTKGQTIGKRLVGTRMIHIDGNAANIIVFLIRQSFFTVFALLGYIDILSDISSVILMIIWIICLIGLFSDEHGRTLQDKFAKTIVVDDKIYLEYRQKAFHEIDHPTQDIDESNMIETPDKEMAEEVVVETLNESITNEEEIL